MRCPIENRFLPNQSTLNIRQRQIPLGGLARVKVATGPAMIRDEGGMLTGYVFVDVAGRDISSYVDEASRVVREQMKLPPGREHPALRLGRQVNLFADPKVYVFARLVAEPHGEGVLVAANNADQPRKLAVDLTDSPIADAHQLSPIFGSAKELELKSQHAAFTMEPRSICILRVE
jgi:hypothetical protein